MNSGSLETGLVAATVALRRVADFFGEEWRK
jgi:hypothetical protein